MSLVTQGMSRFTDMNARMTRPTCWPFVIKKKLVTESRLVEALDKLLAGKRQLTVRHIRELSDRLGIPADVFFERALPWLNQ